MAEDHFLLDRMRLILEKKQINWTEKKMFGGNCFMVDDKMLIGIYKGGLMIRIAPEEAEVLTQRPATDQMIHGGRIMTGYLFVEAEGYDADADLEFWLQKCLEFNPRAKASKKKGGEVSSFNGARARLCF